MQCFIRGFAVVSSPVARLGLPYPAALSFPWPSLTALTLSEREKERERVTESSTRQLSECVHVYNGLIISEEEKQKGR